MWTREQFEKCRYSIDTLRGMSYEQYAEMQKRYDAEIQANQTKQEAQAQARAEGEAKAREVVRQAYNARLERLQTVSSGIYSK